MAVSSSPAWSVQWYMGSLLHTDQHGHTHAVTHITHTHTHRESAVLLNPAVLHYLVHVMAVAHTAHSVIVTKLMVLLCSGS